MDPLIGSSLISAGANIFGGLFGGMSQNAANASNQALAYQQMMQQQNQFNAQMGFAREQFDWNRDFAQNAATQSIRWRVADAAAAGVSPLVALGAQTFNPSPISLGVSPTITGGGGNAVGDQSFPNAMGRMGQDISRAVMATKTAEEKALVAAQTTNLAKEVEEKDARINMLNAQANLYNSRAAGTPNFPAVVSDTGHVIPGQGNSHVSASGQSVTVYPSVGGGQNKLPEITTHNPNSPGVVSGRGSPADQSYWTKGGLLEFQPASGSPASQGDMGNSLMNFIRNRLDPAQVFRRDDPTIMSIIRQKYPDATGYDPIGFGYYRPTFGKGGPPPHSDYHGSY